MGGLWDGGGEYTLSIFLLLGYSDSFEFSKNSHFMSQGGLNQCWLAHPRMGREAGSPEH